VADIDLAAGKVRKLANAIAEHVYGDDTMAIEGFSAEP
jgi:hypothetical protein